MGNDTTVNRKGMTAAPIFLKLLSDTSQAKILPYPPKDGFGLFCGHASKAAGFASKYALF
jgi:hypothetical protein